MVKSASHVKAHETDDGLVLQVHAKDEDETTKVICQLTKLLNKIDGKEGSNSSVPSPAYEEEFDLLFDQSRFAGRVVPIMALVNQQETDVINLSFSDYKKQWLELQERGYACNVVDSRRFMTGAFEFIVEIKPATTTDGDEENNKTIQVLTGVMMKKGKIVYCEQNEEVKKANGQPQKSVIIQAIPTSAVANCNTKTFGPKSSWAFASVSNLGDDDNDTYEEDETIKAGIKNFQALVDLLSGESKEPPEGYVDQFAKVYDKDVHASLKPLANLNSDTTELRDMDYDALYQHHVEAFTLGYKSEVVRIKPHLKGVVAFTVHMDREENELTVRTTVFIDRETGLITHVEAAETIYHEHHEAKSPTNVSGQVVATDTKAIEGFKTEQELAKAVLRVSGKLLAGKKSGIRPCMEAGSVVKLYMVREKHLLHLKQVFHHQGEQLNIYDSEGNPYAGGVHFKEYKRRVVTGKSLVLNNGNGEARALCFQDFVLIDRKAFDIYSTRPLWSGDAPFEQEDKVLCYPWFRMEVHGDPSTRIVYVWNGRGYQSFWKVFLGKKPVKNDDVNSPQHHPPNKGDLVLKTYSLDADLAYVTIHEDEQRVGKDKVRYDITIAPGVDPGLVVCISAVLEIMVGLFG